ncbi:unnamed protein product [Anisakis simplex]|uniref:SSD domain-containing protein n=1 Tax=Anisakis simplex TaxID=6269 RepID=A0A0M3JZF2_ANISI|nr:unnamed protein product [Anisakis simplex]
MRADCVEKRFTRFFSEYARYVLLFPWPFMIVPLITTVLLSLGLSRYPQAFLKDQIDLYIPMNTVAHYEFRQLDSLFHINDSDPFYAIRRYDIKRSGYVIVTAADAEDGNILGVNTIKSVMQLWNSIQLLSVDGDRNRSITYPSICVKLQVPGLFVNLMHLVLSSNVSTPEQICVSNPLIEMHKFMVLNNRLLGNSTIDQLTSTQIIELISMDKKVITNFLGGLAFNGKRQLIDNVFILLSAWRATNINESLERRMMKSFSDASVSITVTSMSDIISFLMFCAYAVVAVLFIYIYQLTFLAGIMALTCKREVSHRHCLTFAIVENHLTNHLNRVTPVPKLNPNMNPSKFNDFAEEGEFERRTEQFSSKNHALAEFFRTTYSDALLNPFIRLVIIILFSFYIVVSIIGYLNVKVGLEANDLLPERSYGRDALEDAEKYFSHSPSYLHVWMHNLSSIGNNHRKLWKVLDKEIELYEYTEYTGASDFWLRAFSSTIQQSGLQLTSDNFAFLVRDKFLSKAHFARYKRLIFDSLKLSFDLLWIIWDIIFNKNYTLLEASRAIVELRFVGAHNQTRAMHLFRRIAENSRLLPTNVYADFFQFAEQYNAVLPTTVTSMLIAGVAVMVVSLLLIPETTASVWVAVTILSINLGIIGFMTFWNVRLDFVSMLTIVMSIGFCVDFASHFAYNFAKGSNPDASQRMRYALYVVGTPILQSSSSTILGGLLF